MAGQNARLIFENDLLSGEISMATPEILASELSAFLARRDAKFAEICQSLAEQLGTGDMGELDAEQRAAITKTAEEQIETWQAQSALTEQAIANPTPLQRLLAEYCEIETQIVKREDEIAARIDDLDDDDDDDD
jgi:hypothetical protein